MNRYANIKKIKNQNENVGSLNTPYYTNVTYPEIPQSENDIWVETEFGDRLDLLADQFYNDTTLYWVISCANPNIINMGSIHVPIGSQIRIPTNITEIIDNYRLINK